MLGSCHSRAITLAVHTWVQALQRYLPSVCLCAAQVASKPGVTVGELQREFARWEEEYDSSAAAAGPAKRRLRNAFVRGSYQQLLANVERAHSQRLLEAERSVKEVGASFLM